MLVLMYKIKNFNYNCKANLIFFFKLKKKINKYIPQYENNLKLTLK